MQLTQHDLQRYTRQMLLPEIGVNGQLQLKQARVLVVGAGGLGCPFLQYLAAAGAGHIGIIDDDAVAISNLHRQILFNTNDVGKNKAATAAEKLLLLNPLIEVQAFATRLTADNATALISEYDVIADCSDNFETRYLVNDTCVQLNKPLISGSIFQFEGQLSVYNYQGGPTYRCLFPEPSEMAACGITGVVGVLPGIIGSYMANEAIKVICHTGTVLSGRLLVINILDNTIRLFQFSRQWIYA
ncbi:adenylyltransferase and sulfurtransferase [Filimonas lacunae]|uniref:Molybdopterin-synthase adenylyltransferase n=1 Tax=Filimonas lacunae TaxID=477680 RepID=A0A173MNH1_9BACT|nr:HesA/MoeB/ThiF family protein [Filimonas lacunae]BAV09184.1 sulfur carrier protein adenylyltransferase ThiF [Filimonas lacunae]SIS68586.1 adenylyltransferase and sulfurtransferase [Filimonas lacunae]